jgi:hypothetical protein
MLKTYIINLNNNNEKINNIIFKIGKNNGLNLMKVNTFQFNNVFINDKIHNLLKLFSENNNNYSLTYLKLIEKLHTKLGDNQYSLIFDNTLIPKYNNIKERIDVIVKEFNGTDWDIIKLYDTSGCLKDCSGTFGLNCFLINKSGQEKIMKYQFSDDDNEKLNLKIFNTKYELFTLNENKGVFGFITKKIHNVNCFIKENFMEILFIKLIIINISVILFFIFK